MLREQGNTAEAIQAFEKIRVGDRDLAWVLLEHARTIASKDVAAARRMVAAAAGFRGQDDTWVTRTKTQVEVQAALAGVAGNAPFLVNGAERRKLTPPPA